MQKTKLEIIEETAAFYNSKNRSVGGGICRYLGDGGKRCAFSRCCVQSEEVNHFLTEQEEKCASSLFYFADKKDLSILKPEYTGHSSYFWDKLQSLHDDSSSWDENGLTSLGEVKKLDLIQTFSHE